MNTHIDQLAEWWENAEEVESGTVAREGDHIITRKHPSPHYPDAVSYVTHLLGKGEDCAITAPYTRILHRAPIPKPAWHDAPAVTATYRDDYGTVTGVWTPSGNHGYWIGPEDDVVMHDSLEDVTPLIEAKVTDGMIDRILDVIAARFDNYPAGIGEEIAAAALGLETT